MLHPVTSSLAFTTDFPIFSTSFWGRSRIIRLHYKVNSMLFEKCSEEKLSESSCRQNFQYGGFFMSIRAIPALSAMVLSGPSPGALATSGARAGLTAAEKRWIAEKPSIRIFPAPADKPIESLDAQDSLHCVTGS